MVSEISNLYNTASYTLVTATFQMKISVEMQKSLIFI